MQIKSVGKMFPVKKVYKVYKVFRDGQLSEQQALEKQQHEEDKKEPLQHIDEIV
jgi:hypothetical protein